jgi:hypothetical protein
MKTSLALYEIADAYLVDLQRLAELDLDEQTVADTLEGLSGELEVKATNVAMFARNLEASAEAIKGAEVQMAARRKAIENRANRIRQYLKENMERTGILKIEGPMFALAIKKNPPAVHVEAQELVPAEFFNQPPPPPPALDKKRVAEALKAGRDVPGCRMEQGTRLDIK